MTYKLIDARQLSANDLDRIVEDLYKINLATYHFIPIKYGRPIWEPPKLRSKLITEYPNVCLRKNEEVEHYVAASNPKLLRDAYYSKLGVTGFVSGVPRSEKERIYAETLNFLKSDLEKLFSPLHLVAELPVDSTILKVCQRFGFVDCSKETKLREILQLFSRTPEDLIGLEDGLSYTTENSHVRSFLAIWPDN